MNHIIDAHIHLDHYSDNELTRLFNHDLSTLKGLLSVSFNLASNKRNLELARAYSPFIKCAFGYHPEQPLPSDSEMADLLDWMSKHRTDMTAIGEVGLPYYMRQQNPGLCRDRYVELLEEYIKLAVKWNKPIVLHAVYDDAQIVCALLEKHNAGRAHFHWFKGDSLTTERMARNGYYVSVTPDVLYESEIQELTKDYPIDQLMTETDGPWPFQGPFAGQLTHPLMIHQSIAKIAKIQQLELELVYKTIYQNTVRFYGF
ncbi:TatD family hydrolase [Fictibacillus aquaticus]|uniref:DNAase n=1 Tax=Fictibacillus aquaticus TaxID=2021314 RepID=A0A235FEX0_9BACL|nr:TatD family hydrolase [Fictibacillus aquaticus]OYD59477.1 DNAase [Fictibacillus aquaticus]